MGKSAAHSVASASCQHGVPGRETSMADSKDKEARGRTLEVPFFAAVVLTVLFYVFVNQEGIKETALHRYTTAHATEYIVVALFFWGVADLAFHCRSFRRELRSLQHSWLFPSDGHESVDVAPSLLAHVESQKPAL